MYINLMDFIMVCLFIVFVLSLELFVLIINRNVCVGYVSRTVSMMDATKLIHNKD